MWYKNSTINYFTCISYIAITRYVATKDKDNNYTTQVFKNNRCVNWFFCITNRKYWIIIQINMTNGIKLVLFHALTYTYTYNQIKEHLVTKGKDNKYSTKKSKNDTVVDSCFCKPNRKNCTRLQ